MVSAGPLISMQLAGKLPFQLQLVACVAWVSVEGKTKAG